MTDPAGKWKTFTAHAMGNMMQVSEPCGLETYCTYNIGNALIRVEMPRGGYPQVRTFNYDPTTLRLQIRLVSLGKSYYLGVHSAAACSNGYRDQSLYRSVDSAR